MLDEVIVMGAGGHGKVVADIIKKSGDILYGFLDDDVSKENILGPISDCVKYKDKFFVIAIGNNYIREKIADKYSELKYYTAIHPTVAISENVTVGSGTVIMANTTINAATKIGKHCIINTSAIVEHENQIEDFVHISPGAVLCGNVYVGKRTHIGAGAVIKNNIQITSDVELGCSACAVKNINRQGIYIGVPAKELRC